jgi:hypothetical protein
MIEFQLWMFPIGAAALLYGMHLIVMWRHGLAEKRWLQDESARRRAAE